MNRKETICAIATAPGSGAIAVIRLSGSNAFTICDTFFSAAGQNKKVSNLTSYPAVCYGTICEKERIIDEVLVSVFKAPRSYTGENTVEISCHGSLFIQQRLLKLFTENGARLAGPGEFTLRAFMNGKMDLSQAEAVADLISSTTKAAHRVALKQMRGGFSSELQNLRTKLVEFTSLIELELDFAEEDVEFADRNQLQKLISDIEQKTDRLIISFDVGNAIKNGIPVAIIGEPNVGKSTLLNVLLNEDRAIVSEIPGTTRDTIEDTMVFEGITFRFIDTAGLRHTNDKVESLGIERTHQMIDKSEIILLVTEPKSNGSFLSNYLSYIPDNNKKLIIVVNKIDQSPVSGVSSMFEKQYETVHISAKKKINIEQLMNSLIDASGYHNIPENDIIVTNVRHYEALQQARSAIRRVAEGLTNQISGDFLAQDIREAIHYLGEITGEITTDEVLGNIFEKFCIGK